jgi:hypothetical protein
MEQHWTCRDFQDGDESHIIRLFKLAFNQEIDLPFWKWRFVENPCGRGIIKLLFEADKLIGHYAVTPVAVRSPASLPKRSSP